MPRCTRSIVLVLIGAGLTLPACDDRERRDVPTPPPEPDGSFGDGPTTNPVAYADGDEGGTNPATSYQYGPTYHPGYHTGMGWLGGTMFNSRPGSRWTPAYGGSHGGSSFSSGAAHSNGFSSHASSGSHTSFGGFGSHASASHGGT